MLDVGMVDYAEILAHIFAHVQELLCSIIAQGHAAVTSKLCKGHVFVFCFVFCS